MKRTLIGALLAALLLAAPSFAQPKDTIVILDNEPFSCRGPIDIDLLKVTMRTTKADAVSLGTGCSGRIVRIEVETWTLDGIKVQNSSPNAAHDVVIQGGYVRSHAFSSGAHQDCIQAMGGARIAISNVVFDCTGPGGGNIFVTRGGSDVTRPTDIVCTHCAIGPNHNNPGAHVRINDSLRSGLRDSIVCRGNTRNPILTTSEATAPVNVANTVLENSDSRCTFDGLLAYTGGSPPPPPPPVKPQLSIASQTTTTVTLTWPVISTAASYNFYRDGARISRSNNGALTRVRFGKLVGTHEYGVGAVHNDGREGFSSVSVHR